MKKLLLLSMVLWSWTGVSAPLMWNELDAVQKADVLAGNQVQVEGANPNLWQVTFYQWIQKNDPHTSPFGSAAVFWDLPGQASYQPGLTSFAIIAGHGTAAVQAIATGAGPSGPVTTIQENAVFKRGPGPNRIWESSWHSTVANQPGAPFVTSFYGKVSFQHFPGDGGGSLIRYESNVIPVAAALGNVPLKNGVFAQFASVVQNHVTRMENGPTVAQIVRLAKALN